MRRMQEDKVDNENLGHAMFNKTRDDNRKVHKNHDESQHEKTHG